MQSGNEVTTMKLSFALLVSALSLVVSGFPQTPDQRGHPQHHEIFHGHENQDHGRPVGFSHIENPVVKSQTVVTVTTVYDEVIATVTVTENLPPDGTTTTAVDAPLRNTVKTPSPSSAAIMSLASPSSTFDFVPQFTTITLLFPGIFALTSTIASPSLPGQIGTVVVREPQRFTTIVSFYTGSTITTLTIATPTIPGQLGTVVIELPQETLPYASTANSLLSTGSAFATSIDIRGSSTLITSLSAASMSGSSAIDSLNAPIGANIRGSSTPITSLSAASMSGSLAIGSLNVPVQTDPLGSSVSVALLSTGQIAGTSATDARGSPLSTNTLESPSSSVSMALRPSTSAINAPAQNSLGSSQAQLLSAIVSSSSQLIQLSPVSATPLVSAGASASSQTTTPTPSASRLGLPSSPSSSLPASSPVGPSSAASLPAASSSTASSPAAPSLAASTPGLSGPGASMLTPSSSAQVMPVSSSTPAACAIQTPVANVTCLNTLPEACQAFASSSLLVSVLNQAQILACQTALAILGTVTAADCFASDILTTLTGANALACLQRRVLCTPCVPGLPGRCSMLFSDTNILDATALSTCQTALGIVGTGVADACFTVGSLVQSLTGVNIANCLRQNVPICSPNPTPVANACISTPSPVCINALPSACQPPLPDVLGIVSFTPLYINNCFTALQSVVGVITATAIRTTCVAANLLTMSSPSFITCLNDHLPFCSPCRALPSVCLPSGGQSGTNCRNALSALDRTAAAACFSSSVLTSVVSVNLETCLRASLHICDI
jgi:hypothetical protein